MTTAVSPQAASAQAVVLPKNRGAYYGGAWHEPKAGRFVDTINPGTGQSLGKVADSGADDIDAAVAAAKTAFNEWRRVLPLERAKILRRIAEILRQNANELAMIDAADCGNPVKEMVSDAMIAAAQVEFFAGFVTEMKGASIPMGPDVVNFSVREPWASSGGSSHSTTPSCSAPENPRLPSLPAIPSSSSRPNNRHSHHCGWRN